MKREVEWSIEEYAAQRGTTAPMAWLREHLEPIVDLVGDELETLSSTAMRKDIDRLESEISELEDEKRDLEYDVARSRATLEETLTRIGNWLKGYKDSLGDASTPITEGASDAIDSVAELVNAIAKEVL